MFNWERKDICRFCLISTPITRSLLHENGVEMYESLTPFKIVDDQNFPTTVCGKCWCNLKLAYNIQQGILMNHLKLQDIDLNAVRENDMIESINIKKENLTDEEEVQGPDIEMIIKGELNEDRLLIEEEEDDEPEPEIKLKDSEYTCVICGYLLSESSISTHVKEHFSSEQHCDECGQNFENLDAYKVHFQLEHSEQQEIWSCEKCEASFKYKCLFITHKEKAHIENNLAKVEIITIKEEALVGGNKIKKPQKLKIANVSTAEDDDIHNMLEEEADADGLFRCPECNKVYGDKKKFETHYKIHRRKKCDICNAMITVSNLRKHIITHSAGPSMCHLCGVTCKNQDSLRGHLYYTHSTNSFPCEHCGKTFKKSYTRLMHVKKVHTGEKNHICDTCGKGFFTHYCLNKHIKMTHMKLRPYICEHCNRGFSSKFALRTHVRQHTNDAPYKCSICGEGFRQNVSLRAHKKSKHDIVEEKNCECKICGKLFSSDWAVLSHMRLH